VTEWISVEDDDECGGFRLSDADMERFVGLLSAGLDRVFAMPLPVPPEVKS
jgi:hypothetical protein